MKKLMLFLVIATALPAIPAFVPTAVAAPSDDIARQVRWGSWKQTSSKKVVLEVKAIQFLLRARGFYPSQPDGIFGAKTAAAVKSFQRNNGLKADGVVGGQTFPKLVRAVKRGDRGDFVRAAQILAREARNHIAEQPYIYLKVDGIYGAQTEDAVKFFQEAVSFPQPVAGLKFTGNTDVMTWKVMFSD